MTRRQRERLLKSAFAFFQSLSRLFLPSYFIKCRRTLLELNSKEQYLNSQTEIKISSLLVYVLHKTRNEAFSFCTIVVQKRRRNVQKSVLHVQSYYCCFFDVLVAVCVVGSQTTKDVFKRRRSTGSGFFSL